MLILRIGFHGNFKTVVTYSLLGWWAPIQIQEIVSILSNQSSNKPSHNIIVVFPEWKGNSVNSGNPINHLSKNWVNLNILSLTCVLLACGNILISYTRGNRFKLQFLQKYVTENI